MPSTEETPSERDTLVARYFGEVRQYALLSVAEEHALWAQIEHCKVRGRRALYMSPVALATLTQRGQQASAQQDTLRTPCAAALDALTTLHAALQALQTQRRAGCGAASERRALREACAGHWHQWLAIWETLGLPAAERQHNAYRARRKYVNKIVRGHQTEPAKVTPARDRLGCRWRLIIIIIVMGECP